MIIDTFLEWLVIFCGVIIALSILLPGPFRIIGLFIISLIPHPDQVNEWLRRRGL